MRSPNPGAESPRPTRRDIIRFGALAFSAPLLLAACGNDQDTAAESADETAQDDETAVSANDARPQGIDVSQFQGDIDWPAVANSGVEFAFVRATEGTTFVDPAFARNWSGSKSAGLLRGAYHFFDGDEAGTTQAEHFLATVGGDLGDLAPVVDIETGSPSQIEIQAWLDTVESAAGVKPIIYTFTSFADQYLSSFGSYPLWIAHSGASSPTLPANWDSWTIWQYGESGSVPGISGSVDRNVYVGPLR